MTEPRHPEEQDQEVLDARVEALLGDPLVWDDPPPALEDAVVAAILAERDEAPVEVTAGDEPAPPGAGHGSLPAAVPLASRRRWLRPALAGAAAAAIFLFAALAVVTQVGDDDGPGGTEVALGGTELAPDASAVATVDDTPLGTRLVLDVEGLEGAPEGSYYQAWLRQDGPEGEGVSAGTFHLRGGDGEIELWAGVSAERFPLVTVTVQDEGEAASSGEVVLRGTVDPD